MEYRLYKRFKDLPKEEWEVLLSDEDFFLSSTCVQILEAEHENEIEALYTIIKDKNKVVGIVYAQLFFINGAKLKDYIKNGKEGFNLLNEIKTNLTNKLNVKVGFLGNVFLTNEESFKLHPDYQKEHILPEVLSLIQTQTAANFVLIPEFYEQSMHLLKDNSREIFVEPDMQLKIPESWHSFNDYLEAISSKYKKRYRKIIAKSEAIEKRELSPTELKHEAEQMKTLFNNVFHKSKFNAAKFNTDVFFDLKLVKDNVSIYGYYLNDKLVGFASDISTNGILYAHFVGIDYELNKEYEIYNRMLYEQIDYAIQNKLTLIKFGRTASEFKSTIGALPHKNFGYIYHPCKSVLRATSPLLKLIKPKKWTQRNPFKTGN